MSDTLDAKLCGECVHYHCPVDGTCLDCIYKRNKPAWEPILKFKVGDRVRMVSNALSKGYSPTISGCPKDSEGTVAYVRAPGEALYYPYIVDYACGRWAAEEEWLEAIEPKTRKICINLGAKCPFCKEEVVPAEPAIVEPTPKFKAGDKVVLIKDGFGFNGYVGCKGIITACTNLRTAYGNMYAVDTTWHNGCVANYEIPESQMELASTAITPVEEKSIDSVEGKSMLNTINNIELQNEQEKQIIKKIEQFANTLFNDLEYDFKLNGYSLTRKV